MLGVDTAPREALGRLCQIAKRDTGQSRRVADFLLAWHNAGENGGWDPTDLWSVDTAIAEDMLAVLKLAKDSHRYPGIWASNQKSTQSGGYGAASVHLKAGG